MKLKFILFVLTSSLFVFQSEAQNELNENGKKQGEWILYHRNDVIKMKGNFDNGLEVDTFQYFDNRKRMHTQLVYTTPGKIAWMKSYNIFGHLQSQGKLVNRKKEGEWISYTTKGTDTLRIDYYKQNILADTSFVFFKNGQIASKIPYKNGIKQGNFVDYFDKGEIHQKGTYLDNVMHGVFELYYRSGKIKMTGQYDKGTKIGVWNFYDVNGTLKKTENYS